LSGQPAPEILEAVPGVTVIDVAQLLARSVAPSPTGDASQPADAD